MYLYFIIKPVDFQLFCVNIARKEFFPALSHFFLTKKRCKKENYLGKKVP